MVVLLGVLVIASGIPIASQFLTTVITDPSEPSPPNDVQGSLLIEVVRTGATEASVSGVAISVTDIVELLIDSNVVATRSPVWNLDYWFLHVPVSDGSTAQTRIGLLTSPIVTVPPYVPQPTGAPGFIYAQGTRLMLDGSPIQLFGVNDDMGFIYTYWGYYGRNYVFPDFDGTIPGVTTPDEFWRAYFRYFLHYQQVGSPRPNLLRVTVGWDFGTEETYYAWKNDPTGYFADFDSMVKWAKAAGVYLVPMLWQGPTDRPYVAEYFDTSSARYAHLVEFERGMMSKYANEPTIAMWDVFNEADTEPTWHSRGGFAAFKAWQQRIVDDVRSATSRLITVGHGMTSAEAHFPNDGFAYNQRWYNAFSDIKGVDVSHIHSYGTAEDQYLIDWTQGWTLALGKPIFAGELAYNEYPSPVGAPYPMGHWPWHTNAWLTADIGPVAEMTWLDNGKGPYGDYPYYGALPDYPSGSFDFAVSLSPASGTVAPGGSVTTSAAATLTSGTTQSVSFSCSGLPPGGSCTFSPVGGSPTFSSTLAIDTASTTPAGPYSITVSATGGGITRTATYSLTVVAPATPCPSAPPSYPSSGWDRVWCDSAFSNLLAQGPDEPLETFDTDWGRGVVAGIRADDIGFRSGRTINLPTAGDYVFVVGGDDGVRLWIDGTLVLDKWFQQPYTSYNVTRSLSAGSHEVRLDYYEGPADARVSFTFSRVTGDATPPGTVTDLAVTSAGTTSVTIQWTAPGDDGASGTASQYDFRYSSQGPITEANFPSASPVASPAPSPAGTIEVLTVTGLSSGTRYWFGLRTGDEVPNWSPLSNIADATTQTPPPLDTTPPVVGITAPENGTTVSGDVQVIAWATDDTSVESVSLYADQILIGVRSSPPWTWIWRTGSFTDGIHRLRAVASDPSGNLGSAAVDVRVENVPPVAPQVVFTTWDPVRSGVEIVFSKPMNRASVETNTRMEPASGHTVTWADDTHMFLALAGPLAEGQTYIVTIDAGATDTEGISMVEGFRFEFLPVPRSTPAFPYTMLEWGLVVGAVAAIAGLIGIRRRRRDPHRYPLPRAGAGRNIREPDPPFPVHPVETEVYVDESVSEAPPSPPNISGRAGADLPGFLALLDEVEKEIVAMTAASLPRPRPASVAQVDSVASLLPLEDEPLPGSSKGPIPTPATWTEVRARSAIEGYLRTRPWARATEIAKDLGMDAKLAARVAISLRDGGSE